MSEKQSRRPITPERRALRQKVKDGSRGGNGGPHDVMGISAELNRRVREVGKYLNLETCLEQRLRQLAIIVVARLRTAQVEWYAHAPRALEAGISTTVVEAISKNQPPPFKKDDERVVFQVTRELVKDNQITDETFATATRLLGVEALIDLITLIGYYNLIAWVLFTYRIEPLKDATQLLPEL
jgi:4-carboxymuconolactone decarboxylase